jgi:hypothetical protein
MDAEKSMKNKISEPFGNLFIPEATFNMIIHHTGGLHVRINNG